MVLHHFSDLQIFNNDCFWQSVDDLSGDLMVIVGQQVFQFIMNNGNDLFLLLVVSAVPQWPFIDRLSMPVSIFSAYLFIMADVGVLLAGQASLLLLQSSLQFSEPWALIDVFIEGPVRQISKHFESQVDAQDC